MTKRNKGILAIIGMALLCSIGYFWIVGPGARWQSYQPGKYAPQKDKQDPVDLAYELADFPSLIAGVEKQGDKLYVGTPTWQADRDVFGVEAPSQKGRIHFLDYKQFEDEWDSTYLKGAVMFRMETQGDHPVQVLGIQPLHYDTEHKRVVAASKPLLGVVSQPNGKVDYDFFSLAGDIAMFRFGKSSSTPQGYQRTDAGMVAFTLTSNRLLPTLHYIADLTPHERQCKTGQTTPCRQIINTLSFEETPGDAGSAHFPSVKLDSMLITERGKQIQNYRLKYDPANHRFLLSDGSGIDSIESLSPTRTDVFLAAQPSAQ
ncbi:hypothetical protein [Paludibacterium sp.]|uniref:hypothetical protein n=1 Tax=Paludibacterium sp. TaxID=1917523 RepID=UPI0025F4107A|nr:hypothetical protein [Paludibacterium sp.]MBV8648608.1 hypothetical protein [Paludibacterium sp.]